MTASTLRLGVAGAILVLAATVPSSSLAQAKPAAAPAKPAAAAPATVRTTFAGVNIALPIPPGYCAIPRTGAGQPFYQLQERSNTGSNVVAVLFTDCKEWQMREKDPKYRLRKHGSYLLQLMEGVQTLAPAGYSRARYLSDVSGLKFESEDLRKEVNQKVDTSGIESGKLNSLSIRPLSVDTHGAYLVGVSEVAFPQGKVMVCALIGATLVKGVPVSLNLYRDYEGTASILAAHKDQKANLVRLDQANP